MDRINAQNVRKLNLGVHDTEFKALESFLKGLRVSVKNPGSRRFTMRTIQRLEPRAGYHLFSRYGEKEIKVMVSEGSELCHAVRCLPFFDTAPPRLISGMPMVSRLTQILLASASQSRMLL